MSFTHEEHSPTVRPATASAFADWVFHATTSMRNRAHDSAYDYRRRELLHLGKLTHRDIELFLCYRWTLDNLGRGSPKSWTLMYADPQDNTGGHFLAGKLTVGGEPLRCRPDCVLKNHENGIVLIIERKTTFVSPGYIPPEGWPNVEVQLWCYSWIDDWLEASDVLLVGQLWVREGSAIKLAPSHSFWKRSDAEHHQRCSGWFERYGGTVA